MQLCLQADVIRRMRRHMLRAGSREIGGMIMGEQTGDQQFRVVDFTIDATSGSPSNFTRDAEQHDQALAEFFKTTGADYHRFNYLGEWHTHPRFSVHPSLQDMHAMQDLVDGSGGVDFAVLLIARLKWFGRFESSAHLFVDGYVPSAIMQIYDN
ncbi:Mov34/MPN/PAD-1 family protein [Celeribacter halophilus]|uniref:Mov34/MPN/PAD-1 family protein n=1 Tax=Celeribacter halophilus TaxID=576117 RepID=UPI001C08CE8A|nr:Mov34/MPN/PAD-1 family protein [Celeribacter halophilus]MBU2888241.1 Mov34/MPN/PAD-1 family protein [Celeribacter halophilus]MDO6512287.1 Mov34/MPN/PAD-1 family protein [Celeribacter halophilus]